MRMLTHVVGILCLAYFSVGDVPSRLYAVSHLKGLINEIKDKLIDFRNNMTQELKTLENESKSNETACLKDISQAHNETTKLLNMLVEGERSELETAEASMESMSLHDLTNLWGKLVPGGKSREKVLNEFVKYKNGAEARFIDLTKNCKTEGSKNGTTQANRNS